MDTNSPGRTAVSTRPPEIFTDDLAEPPAPRTPLRLSTPQRPVVNPNDLLDEEDDAPVPPRRAAPRAVDPWADVHPEAAKISTGRKPGALPLVAEPIARETPPAVTEGSDEIDPEPTTPDRGGGWTIPMLCAGIAVIAACLLVPLAEENHQLVYQRERLKLDLEQVKKQVSVNDEFLKRINDDPMLAERLAQRQMKTIRQGEAVLDLPSNGREEMSPFMLVTVPPPAPMPPYRPVGGMLAAATRQPRTRLFLMGGGLFLIMFGLVLGYSKD